jgi:prepilin-type N-terminal cleavage/methylation domain-containing protein
MDTKHGFTLVEMSVVLLIIGLIIGAIVVGHEVISNAELQTVIADVNRFKNAAKQFQDKYSYLPGDFPKATTFWFSDTGCPGGSTVFPWSPRTVTCNGNGDGKIRDLGIGSHYTTPELPGDSNYESLRVWQHLANAGFIEGLYSGVGYEAGSMYKPGINIPMSKMNVNSGFIFFYSDPINTAQEDPSTTPHSAVYPSSYGNIIEYGGGVNTIAAAQGFRAAPGLTATQAKSLDQKTDDGMPSTGNVLSFTTATQDCNDASSPPAYNISNTGIVCSLIFLTGL